MGEPASGCAGALVCWERARRVRHVNAFERERLQLWKRADHEKRTRSRLGARRTGKGREKGSVCAGGALVYSWRGMRMGLGGAGFGGPERQTGGGSDCV